MIISVGGTICMSRLFVSIPPMLGESSTALRHPSRIEGRKRSSTDSSTSDSTSVNGRAGAFSESVSAFCPQEASMSRAASEPSSCTTTGTRSGERCTAAKALTSGTDSINS